MDKRTTRQYSTRRRRRGPRKTDIIKSQTCEGASTCPSTANPSAVPENGNIRTDDTHTTKQNHYRIWCSCSVLYGASTRRVTDENDRSAFWRSSPLTRRQTCNTTRRKVGWQFRHARTVLCNVCVTHTLRVTVSNRVRLLTFASATGMEPGAARRRWGSHVWEQLTYSNLLYACDRECTRYEWVGAVFVVLSVRPGDKWSLASGPNYLSVITLAYATLLLSSTTCINTLVDTSNGFFPLCFVLLGRPRAVCIVLTSFTNINIKTDNRITKEDGEKSLLLEGKNTYVYIWVGNDVNTCASAFL